MIMNIQAKAGTVPTRGSSEAAGLDLRSATSVLIPVGGIDKVKIPTGIKVEIPKGHFGMVVPRSGLGSKHRVTLANDVGIIDSDYRGEIFCFMVNDGIEDYRIEQYDRIAQLIIIPYTFVDLNLVEELSSTNRGEDGFGSSGVK